MAKRTAVIDIGSNSARMVVFEKSSTYAFHLVKRLKVVYALEKEPMKMGEFSKKFQCKGLMMP